MEPKGSPHSGAPDAASPSAASAGPAKEPLPSAAAEEATAGKKGPPIAWEGTESRLRQSPFLRLWKLRVEQGACRGGEHGSQPPAFPQPPAPPCCCGLFQPLVWLLAGLLWVLTAVLKCCLTHTCLARTCCARCCDPGPPPPPPGCTCLAAAPPSAMPCAIDLAPGAALTEEQVRALPVPRRNPFISHVLEAVVKPVPTFFYYALPCLTFIVLVATEIGSYSAAYTFDVLTCAVPALNLNATLGNCAEVIKYGDKNCVKHSLSWFVWWGGETSSLIAVALLFGTSLFAVIYLFMVWLRRWAIKLLPFHIYVARRKAFMLVLVGFFFFYSVMYVGLKVRK